MKELWGKDFRFLLDAKCILLLLKTFSIKSKINKNKVLEIMLKVTKICYVAITISFKKYRNVFYGILGLISDTKEF